MLRFARFPILRLTTGGVEPLGRRENLHRNLAPIEELKEVATVAECTPAQGALALVPSCGHSYRPDPGTNRRHGLEENAATVLLKISADGEDALLQVFAPGAASGLRYPRTTSGV